MQKQFFGSTDLWTTPLCFGAWQIGGFPFYKDCERDHAIALVHAVLDLGVNFIDTAPVYGFGLSEEILGEALQGRRHELVLSSKCGLQWDKESLSAIHKCATREAIMRDVEQSLQRLQTDYIDLYLLHWLDVNTPLEESILALQELKDQGVVKHIGVSNFSLEKMQEAVTFGDVEALQSRLSRLRPEITPEMRIFCLERGIGIQAYSPLERGLLTGQTWQNLKDKDEAAIHWALKNAPKGYETKIETWAKEADAQGLSLTQASLKWVCDLEGVSCAIVGSTNKDHIAECLQSFSV